MKRKQFFMFVVTLIGVAIGVVVKRYIPILRGVWLNKSVKIHFSGDEIMPLVNQNLVKMSALLF